MDWSYNFFTPGRFCLSKTFKTRHHKGGWVFYLKCLSCTSFPHHLLRKISFQLKKIVPYIIYSLYALSSRVRNCRPTFFKIGSYIAFCNILIRFVNQTNPITLTSFRGGRFPPKVWLLRQQFDNITLSPDNMVKLIPKKL